MIADYYTAKKIAEVLDIYEVSAIELFNGVIRFKASELEELADAAGITVEELLKERDTDHPAASTPRSSLNIKSF